MDDEIQWRNAYNVKFHNACAYPPQTGAEHDLSWKELFQLRNVAVPQQPSSSSATTTSTTGGETSNNNIVSINANQVSYKDLPMDQLLLDSRFQPAFCISIIEQEYDRLLKVLNKCKKTSSSSSSSSPISSPTTPYLSSNSNANTTTTNIINVSVTNFRNFIHDLAKFYVSRCSSENSAENNKNNDTCATYFCEAIAHHFKKRSSSFSEQDLLELADTLVPLGSLWLKTSEKELHEPIISTSISTSSSTMNVSTSTSTSASTSSSSQQCIPYRCVPPLFVPLSNAGRNHYLVLPFPQKNITIPTTTASGQSIPQSVQKAALAAATAAANAAHQTAKNIANESLLSPFHPLFLPLLLHDAFRNACSVGCTSREQQSPSQSQQQEQTSSSSANNSGGNIYDYFTSSSSKNNSSTTKATSTKRFVKRLSEIVEKLRKTGNSYEISMNNSFTSPMSPPLNTDNKNDNNNNNNITIPSPPSSTNYSIHHQQQQQRTPSFHRRGSGSNLVRSHGRRGSNSNLLLSTSSPPTTATHQYHSHSGGHHGGGKLSYQQEKQRREEVERKLRDQYEEEIDVREEYIKKQQDQGEIGELMSEDVATAMLEVTSLLNEMLPVLVNSDEHMILSCITSFVVRRAESLVSQKPSHWYYFVENGGSVSSVLTTENTRFEEKKRNRMKMEQEEEDQKQRIKNNSILRIPYDFVNLSSSSATAAAASSKSTSFSSFQQQQQEQEDHLEKNEDPKDGSVLFSIKEILENNSTCSSDTSSSWTPLEVLLHTGSFQRSLLFSTILDDALSQVDCPYPMTPEDQHEFFWCLMTLRNALRSSLLQGDVERCQKLNVQFVTTPTADISGNDISASNINSSTEKVNINSNFSSPTLNAPPATTTAFGSFASIASPFSSSFRNISSPSLFSTSSPLATSFFSPNSSSFSASIGSLGTGGGNVSLQALTNNLTQQRHQMMNTFLSRVARARIANREINNNVPSTAIIDNNNHNVNNILINNKNKDHQLQFLTALLMFSPGIIIPPPSTNSLAICKRWVLPFTFDEDDDEEQTNNNDNDKNNNDGEDNDDEEENGNNESTIFDETQMSITDFENNFHQRKDSLSKSNNNNSSNNNNNNKKNNQNKKKALLKSFVKFCNDEIHSIVDLTSSNNKKKEQKNNNNSDKQSVAVVLNEYFGNSSSSQNRKHLHLGLDDAHRARALFTTTSLITCSGLFARESNLSKKIFSQFPTAQDAMNSISVPSPKNIVRPNELADLLHHLTRNVCQQQEWREMFHHVLFSKRKEEKELNSVVVVVGDDILVSPLKKSSTTTTTTKQLKKRVKREIRAADAFFDTVSTETAVAPVLPPVQDRRQQLQQKGSEISEMRSLIKKRYKNPKN